MDLKTSLALLTKAVDIAEKGGYAMSFAIVDASGNEVAMHRMDGAGFLSPRIAIAKSYTAAATGAPTSTLADGLSHAPYFVTASTVLTDGKYLAGGGGLPIRINGELCGGMGASGGTAAQDAEVVGKAIRAISGIDDPEAI